METVPSSPTAQTLRTLVMSAKKPWTVQWHIAPDGTVFKQRSRGDQEHQQLFQTFGVRDDVTVEGLDAMDERISKNSKFFLTLVIGLIAVGITALVSLLGSFTLPWFGVSERVAGSILIVSVVVFVLITMTSGGLVGWSISRATRICQDAGLESPNGVTLSAREARAMIADPRTTSGRKVASVRG